MDKPNIAMQKAIETEKQVLNIALYKKQAVSILAEINSNEFFIDSFKKIKIIIDSMIADNKTISLTSVYNEIMDKKLQEEYVLFAADPLIIDPATAYDQFKKFHRLVNMQPKIEELLYMSWGCDMNFEDKFNELTEMYITSKVLQEATELSQLMKVDLKQIHDKYTRFKSGIQSLDNKIQWLYGGQYICIAGAPGCISGDSIIRFNRKGKGFKKTIKDAYYLLHHIGRKDAYWDKAYPTFVRSFNGKTVQLHEIETINYSGIREVFEVKLLNGKSIKATSDHKIMSSDGWVELKDLTLKSKVMCDTPKSISKTKIYKKIKDKEFCGLLYHPFARIRSYRNGKRVGRIEIHRAIYEAHMNNLSVEEYINILKTDKEKSSNMYFVKKENIIHHKDYNHFNNDINNLIEMDRIDHCKLHSEENKFNFNQGCVIFSKVKSIKKIGIEDTYDIVCKDPYRNFSANDIIIHNSGKTTMGINIAVNVPNSLMMSYEMSEEEIHNIVLSRHLAMDSEKIESGELDFGEKQAVNIARRELSEKLTLKVCDKPLYLNDLMAFIKSAVYRYGIKLVVIDYAQIIPGLKSSGTQTEKFEDMSRRFKLIARELRISVIALSGLTKDSLKEGRAPTLADLRGSLSFGADADKVIVLYEIPDENTMGKGTPQSSVIKNRKGRIGKLDGFYYNKPIHLIN